MTSEDACIPTARLLQNAAGEIADIIVLLRKLEQATCDLVSLDSSMASRGSKELQAFDLLAQRLTGMSACLHLLAGSIVSGTEVPIARFAKILPLAVQRQSLLGEIPSAAMAVVGARPELF